MKSNSIDCKFLNHPSNKGFSSNNKNAFPIFLPISAYTRNKKGLRENLCNSTLQVHKLIIFQILSFLSLSSRARGSCPRPALTIAKFKFPLMMSVIIAITITIIIARKAGSCWPLTSISEAGGAPPAPPGSDRVRSPRVGVTPLPSRPRTSAAPSAVRDGTGATARAGRGRCPPCPQVPPEPRVGKERAREGSEGRGSSRTCDAPGRPFAYSHQRRAHLSSARRRCLLHPPPPTHHHPAPTFPSLPFPWLRSPAAALPAQKRGRGGRGRVGSGCLTSAPALPGIPRASDSNFGETSFKGFYFCLSLSSSSSSSSSRVVTGFIKKIKKRQLHVSSQPGHGEVWGSGGREQRREGHSSMPYKRQPKARIFF